MCTRATAVVFRLSCFWSPVLSAVHVCMSGSPICTYIHRDSTGCREPSTPFEHLLALHAMGARSASEIRPISDLLQASDRRNLRLGIIAASTSSHSFRFAVQPARGRYLHAELAAVSSACRVFFPWTPRNQISALLPGVPYAPPNSRYR